MTENDTKNKIIKTARALFATKGFNGTSVRDIARQADVNLSAVNYHFTNKDNLFWAVFQAGYIEMESRFAAIAVDNLSVGEIALEFYRTMLENWEDLQNTFRLILSGTLPAIDGEVRSFCVGKMGPPGAPIFSAAVLREIGEDVPEAGLLWASQCVFSSLVHWALISGTNYLKEFGENSPICKSEVMEQTILEFTKAITNHLRDNKEKFAE